MKAVIIAVLFFVVFSILPLNALAKIYIKNNITSLKKEDVATIPDGKIFKLYSVTFSDAYNGSIVDIVNGVYVLKSGDRITSNLNFSSGSPIQINFNPPVVFYSGDTIQVYSGTGSIYPINVMFQGTLRTQ